MSEPHVGISVEGGDWPPEAELAALARRAVDAALGALGERTLPSPLPNPPPQGGRESVAASEISLLFTVDAAMQALNARWRGIDRPTNVLSFPQAAGPSLSSDLLQQGGEPLFLGDIALAAETVAREAALAQKPLEDHIAHLIIHGFFHLLGYDHALEAEAAAMEQLERAALERMGIADPYADASR